MSINVNDKIPNVTLKVMGEKGRYAMIIDNGVVKHLAVEPKGAVDVSAAEKILKLL